MAQIANLRQQENTKSSFGGKETNIFPKELPFPAAE